MNQLSDEARLYWPFYYLGSNGFARIEINHRLIGGSIFHGFHKPPTRAEMVGHFREYQDRFLCFIYESNGATWGQFWVPDSKLLPRYKTADTNKSPAPPKKAYESWLNQYKSQKSESRALQSFFGELPKSSENVSEGFPLGYGSGKGIGIGVGDEKDLRPSGTDGFLADEGYREFAELYRPLKDYGLNGPAPMQAYAAVVGDSPNAAIIHGRIMEGVGRMALSGRERKHMPTAENFLKKKHYLDKWEPEENSTSQSALARAAARLIEEESHAN